MFEYNKRNGDKLANNMNLTIKIIGFLVITLMSIISFGINLSVDVAKDVSKDIKIIRDIVSIIQSDNKLNAQAIAFNKKNQDKHERSDNERFRELYSKISSIKQ